MTALATLLADPSRTISYVVEFVERDPDTDTETTLRYQTPNRTASDGLPPLLADPGGRNDKLEVDEMAAIAAQTVEPIKLTNQPASVGVAGPLDFLRDRSLSGRAITIYAGAAEEAFANYEAVASGVIDHFGAVFDGNVVEVRIKSPLERLHVDLDVGTYVGEPGALHAITATAANATTASVAAHQLSTFTLAGRIRVDSLASGVIRHAMARLASGTDTNWQCGVMGSNQGANAGGFRARYSSGGVANVVNIFSSGGLVNDGDWHWWVFARSTGHAYLMVDGVIIGEVSNPAAPDTGAAGIQHCADGNVCCDHRLFDHYIAPDEMRAAMAVRADGGETGLVGLWRSDDNTGASLTDYSSTAAHATISGIEGVDFEWVSSDLGTAELAGRSMPALIGSVWNAPADLVDPFRERWRASDIGQSVGTPTVRDEGEALTSGVDYDWPSGSGVLELTAAAGEPVTVGREHTAGLNNGASLPEVLGMLMRETGFGPSFDAGYGPLAAAEVNLSRLDAIYQVRSGMFTRRRTVREAVTDYVSGGLGFLASTADGVIRPDVVVPPTAPSPRDGACLEFSGSPSTNGRVRWAATIATGGVNFTKVLWFKSHRWGPSESSAAVGQRVTLMDLGGDSALNGARLYLDLSAGVPRLVWTRWATSAAAATVSVGIGDIFSTAGNDWHFISAVNDDTGGACRFYYARQGESVRLIGTTADLGFSAAPQGPLYVAQDDSLNDGAFRGSIFEPQIWASALSLAALQDLMDSPPAGNEVGLSFFAPLDGIAAASLADTVSGAAGTAQGDVREVPDLVLDLDVNPKAFSSRRLRPAHTIAVEYRRNFAVLDAANITATVSQEDALALQTAAQAERWVNPEIAADYLDARAVAVPSHWFSETGARATLRIGRYRFAPGRELAEIKAADRRALLLAIGDEVRVYGSRWGLDAGTVFRVASNHARFAELTCDLGLWR